ncbi:helix-turn-helix domain-containing protein [Myxococcus virescens]|uniref:DnaJ domain-containing protein n=1 Tax=Myxococcus virescens TaxID=83456 RepID=A0ABY0MSV5_9BACT|nr:helix-turn-helix domain-containing protein [Myxococcus virescens]SDE45181.1 DnaJ domain-containing protein [Myxococcus virescens]
MKPFEQQTYYEILEVPVTAPKEEIRAAYERLTELYSPDSIAVYALVDEGQVDELRTRLAEALEILSDEELRAEYDKDLGLPARRLMDAVSTGGEVAHAAAPLEARAGLVGVAASGAEDQTGHLSTQVPETGTNGRTGAVRDVPVEDSETAMTGQGGEGEAGAHATEPRVEPVPASSGHADFRASFFRGFSFAYVSSSLQDTQRMGSAVDVPVASIQPQVSGSGTGTGAASAESQREASGAVAAAPVGEPSAAHEAAAGGPGVVAASATASVSPGGPAVTGSAPALATAPQVSVPSSGSDASVTASATVPTPGPAAGAVSALAPVSDAPAAAAVPTPGPAGAVSALAPVSDAPAAAAVPAPASAAPVSAPVAESSAAVAASATPASGPAAAPAPTQGAPVSAVAALPPSAPATAATGAPASEASAEPHPPVPASASPVPPASQAPDAESTALVPVRPSPGTEAQPEAGRAGARPGRPLGDAPQIAQDSAIATAEAALAQASQAASRAREPRPRIPDIPSDAEFNGELLRQVREARGVTLQQVADRTRITRMHLENVEADRYNLLPPSVYLRGILMSLARELGLDPLRVSKSYLALSSEKSGRK